MESITIHPRDKKQLKALLTIFQDMKIPYEAASGQKEGPAALEEEESPYDPEFVEMVKKAEEDLKKGKGKKIKLEYIWK